MKIMMQMSVIKTKKVIGLFKERLRNWHRAKEKTIQFIGNFLLALVILCTGIAMFFSVQNKLAGHGATIFGNHVYTVLSGSMEPSLHVGSLVFVKPVAVRDLKVGDVLNFRTGSSTDTVTHRITEVLAGDPLSFMTKGDANDGADATAVTADQVVGKATFSIPLLGYFVHFAQSKNGLLALVIVPGVLILVLETTRVFKYLIAMDREKQRKLLEQQQQKAAEERGENLA